LDETPAFRQKNDPDDMPVRPEQISNLSEHPEFQQKANIAAPKDDASQEQAVDDDAVPGSSKEKFYRLNPYYEDVINQLKIAFDDYAVPGDFMHKLAEGYAIINGGDPFSNGLLLTITKLKPLITKKLDISWTDLKKIIATIIKRIKDQQYDYYTFDNIPDDKWFHANKVGIPQSDYMDIALGIKRLTSCKTMFDEWDETHVISNIKTSRKLPR
jgi:hypothetical protein